MSNQRINRFLLPGSAGRVGILGFGLCFGLMLSPAAFATDGVAEINHTCAVHTGCFPGDTAGYPVTIGQAGKSYRLTSDLIVPDEHTSGITLNASDVGLDLNNFSIVRSGCETATTSCVARAGFGVGVAGGSVVTRGASVKNGSITGMGYWGVYLGEQSEVSGVRVRWNRSGGIQAGSGSTLTGNTAYQNGGEGIRASGGSTLSGNTAYQNVRGVYGYNGSTISNNTTYENSGDGVYCTWGCAVRGNTARANGGYGLYLGLNSGYRENVITDNALGTVSTGGSVNMGNNACDGTTTCP